jgi:hypothetical protein
VKTLTESSGVGVGVGEGRGLAGSWLEICVAASAKIAAMTRRPVVRFSQNIVGVGCWMPGRNLRCLIRFSRKGAKEAKTRPFLYVFRACAWTAVIAIASTMSRAVQPRDKSFAGLSRPWRIGPTAVAPANLSVSL